MDLKALYGQLVREWSGGRERNMARVGQVLTRLKLVLSQEGLLVPDLSSIEQGRDVGSLVMAREILEIGALYSIHTASIPSFERYTSLLQPFYNELGPILASSSSSRAVLTSLILLNLLAHNRISAFHILLENLPEDLIQSVEVEHPVRIEQWLMEGNYGKVWASRDQVPCEESKFFIDSLMGTIRTEIASCEEKAYHFLPLNNAATLLFFTTMQDLLVFATARGWTVNKSEQRVYFNKERQQQLQAMEEEEGGRLPVQEIIKQNLRYAAELEAIV